MNVLEKIWRKQGITVFVYLDDILVLGHSRQNVRKNLNLVISTLVEWVFKINAKKSVLDAIQNLSHLGFLVNFQKRVVTSNVLSKNFKYFGPGEKLPYGSAFLESGHRPINGVCKFTHPERVGSRKFHTPGPKRTNKGVKNISGPQFRETVRNKSYKRVLFRQFRFRLGGWTPKRGKWYKIFGEKKVFGT